MDDEPLPALLRSIREQSELSTRELGARLGVHHGQVARIENSERKPSIDYLEKFAEVFNIDATKLIELSGISVPLPPLNTYFRRKLGVNADEAAVLEGLIRDYQTQHNREEETNDKDANQGRNDEAT